MRNNSTYGFRKMERADLSLVGSWLSAPHVQRWWGDPEDSLGEIADILELELVSPFIATLFGRPIGYFQYYDPQAEIGHPYSDQPSGTYGIDQFIGEAELLGLGHGTALIKAFVARLEGDGAKRVIADPDPDNRAAIRSYEKAGFTRLKVRNTEYGDVLLMRYDPVKESRK